MATGKSTPPSNILWYSVILTIFKGYFRKMEHFNVLIFLVSIVLVIFLNNKEAFIASHLH